MAKKRVAKVQESPAEELPVDSVFPEEPAVDFPQGAADEAPSVPDRAREAIESVVEEDVVEAAEKDRGPVLAQGETGSGQTQAAGPVANPPAPAASLSADTGSAVWTTIIVKQPWGYEFKKVARMTRSEAIQMVNRNEWNRAGGAIVIQGERIM